MVFSQSASKDCTRDVWGSRCIVMGTFTGTGVTTGELNCYLHRVEQLFLQPNASASPAIQCNVDETFPVLGSALTINFTSGVCGYWLAIGDAFA
jgi:hypothetical protein